MAIAPTRLAAVTANLPNAAAVARRSNPAAVNTIPMEYVDDTLGCNPEWIVDRIAPRPILFITSDSDRLVLPEESLHLYKRADQPNKLVVLTGYGRYDVSSTRMTMPAKTCCRA